MTSNDDGPAIRAVYLAPAPPDVWLRGRNLAQGLFATTQVVGLGLVLYLLLPRASSVPSPRRLDCAR